MKFFLDTANVAEIKKGVEMGLVDGVTTNPSLIAKTGREARQVLEEICHLVPGPVSAEVLATDVAGMVAEGKRLAAIADNIAVKIPMTADGLRAVRVLRAEDIAVNVTLVFSATQALLVAKAGATFVSPFIGRLDDVSHEGMDLIDDIVQIYANYEFDTEIIVASVRHPVHVLESARLGADIVTVPFDVLLKLMQHPLTDIGIKKFLDDAKKIPGTYI